MLDNLKKYKIILASHSPRRRELLAGLDIDYTVRVPEGVDESYPPGMAAHDIPLYIAREKAAASRAFMSADELVITADTVVLIDGRVLGKPADEAEARDMLRTLSGRTHHVVTGVCLTTAARQSAFDVDTAVTFKTLTEEEIDYYVPRYRPLDKAGAYGVQEWIGYVAVTALQGSFYNVMGLPVQRIYDELRTF